MHSTVAPTRSFREGSGAVVEGQLGIDGVSLLLILLTIVCNYVCLFSYHRSSSSVRRNRTASRRRRAPP